jgi:hypothetical protein
VFYLFGRRSTCPGLFAPRSNAPNSISPRPAGENTHASTCTTHTTHKRRLGIDHENYIRLYVSPSRTLATIDRAIIHFGGALYMSNRTLLLAAGADLQICINGCCWHARLRATNTITDAKEQRAGRFHGVCRLAHKLGLALW